MNIWTNWNNYLNQAGKNKSFSCKGHLPWLSQKQSATLVSRGVTSWTSKIWSDRDFNSRMPLLHLHHDKLNQHMNGRHTEGAPTAASRRLWPVWDCFSQQKDLPIIVSGHGIIHIRDSAQIWGPPIRTTNYSYTFHIVFAPVGHPAFVSLGLERLLYNSSYLQYTWFWFSFVFFSLARFTRGFFLKLFCSSGHFHLGVGWT